MPFHKHAIMLGMGLLMAVSAQAQPSAPAPEGFKFLSAKQVQALTDNPGIGPKTAHLAGHTTYDVEYALRGDAGNQVEVHAHTSHYIHILKGRGTLTYGGTVLAPQNTAPGEIRANAVSGGTIVVLHAGDYLQIPAGTPHLFNAAKGTQLYYLVFNIKS